jgi:5-methylthioadenosine/S-adenosylhomocysteine deaminase
MIVVDFPTRYAESADDYIAKGLELHDRYRDHALVRTGFAPHSPYAVSDAALEGVRTLADELEVPVHIHLHETRDEVVQSLREHGERPLARLDRIGLVGPGLVAVHMTQLGNAEIAAFAAAGGHVVHCPESNLKLASGFCPVQALLAAGVNVALGTDSAASNNDLDMLGEMRTAALLAKGTSGDASALPAHEVLRMATLNGASALGLGEETGSLVPGKWADLTAVNLDTPETQPVYDPVSQLVYAGGREQVTDVWVAGRQLLKERRLTTLDGNDILARTRGWRDRIQSTHQTKRVEP